MGCSYVGIASTRPVAWPLYKDLRILQHRGQETAGIFTFDGRIRRKGGPGLVNHVFGDGGEETAKKLRFFGSACWGLASTRYRTSGTDKSSPPFFIRNPCLVAGAFNGNVINCNELWNELNKVGQYRSNDCDFEVLLNTYGHELSKVMKPMEALRNVHIYTAAANMMDKVEGSYSAVFIVAKGRRQRMVGIRDPSANRPMVIGKAKDQNGWIIASEDCQFSDLGYEVMKYPEGGEVNIINWRLEHQSKNLIKEPIMDPDRESEKNPIGLVREPVVSRGGEGRCMFEWMYFARPDSEIEGRWVEAVRYRMGYKGGKRETRTVDMVIPSPDSGRAAVPGYVKGYNENFRERFIGRTLDRAALDEMNDGEIAYRDGIYKSPYAIRLFQASSEEERKANMDIKHSPNPSVVTGMRIVHKDDSTVRLATLSHLIQREYDAGAKEIHVRIDTPLIKSFCPLGIDMRSKEELVAYRGFKKISDYLDLPNAREAFDRAIIAGSMEAAARELHMDPAGLKERMEQADRLVIEEINKELGADSLDYCTIAELVEAINEVPARHGAPASLPYERLCTGCLGGRYPIAGNVMERLLKTDNGGGRAWEAQPQLKRPA